MGEYAIYKKDRIKVGTCEDLLYLRADQFAALQDPGDLPRSLEECGEAGFRFRFPFPDEDQTAPGCFEDPFKALTVPDSLDLMWDGARHSPVQFSYRPNGPVSGGFLVSLPCPNDPTWKAGEYQGDKPTGAFYQVHVNGFQNGIQIVAQRPIGGELWTIVQCASCKAKWRLDYSEACRVAVKLRSHADKLTSTRAGLPSTAAALHTVADRILAGYPKALLSVPF